MADPETGVAGVFLNRFIVICWFFSCAVVALEGAVFRSYIALPSTGAALAAKNIIFITVIFSLLVKYISSVYPRAGDMRFGRLIAAYIAHALKTGIVIGIPLKLLIWLYLKLASDDFGVDPFAAFNDSKWLSFAYYSVILTVTVIGYAVINNTGTSSRSLVKSLRFIFSRYGAAAVSVLAAFFIAVAALDYLARLIEYRTVVSLIVDSVIYPIRYYLLFIVVYAVSNIAADGKDTVMTG